MGQGFLKSIGNFLAISGFLNLIYQLVSENLILNSLKTQLNTENNFLSLIFHIPNLTIYLVLFLFIITLFYLFQYSFAYICIIIIQLSIACYNYCFNFNDFFIDIFQIGFLIMTFPNLQYNKLIFVDEQLQYISEISKPHTL